MTAASIKRLLSHYSLQYLVTLEPICRRFRIHPAQSVTSLSPAGVQLTATESDWLLLMVMVISMCALHFSFMVIGYRIINDTIVRHVDVYATKLVTCLVETRQNTIHNAAHTRMPRATPVGREATDKPSESGVHRRNLRGFHDGCSKMAWHVA